MAGQMHARPIPSLLPKKELARKDIRHQNAFESDISQWAVPFPLSSVH